tara:strand:- start:1296 stop:1652 length:357 start_codon:yes stop_codon:yes gene_type:complete
MEFDPEIVEWTDLHGSVSDFSFMVFCSVEHVELQMLAKGIAEHLKMAEIRSEMLIYSKEIDEEEARMLQTYQGTNVHVVIPKSDNNIEALIVLLTRDCFEHLRIKSEYVGYSESDSLV